MVGLWWSRGFLQAGMGDAFSQNQEECTTSDQSKQAIVRSLPSLRSCVGSEFVLHSHLVSSMMKLRTTTWIANSQRIPRDLSDTSQICNIGSGCGKYGNHSCLTAWSLVWSFRSGSTPFAGQISINVVLLLNPTLQGPRLLSSFTPLLSSQAPDVGRPNVTRVLFYVFDGIG